MGSSNHEVERLSALLLERDVQIATLMVRVAELKKLLGRNSKNSSLPPSAEGFTKAPVIANAVTLQSIDSSPHSPTQRTQLLTNSVFAVLREPRCRIATAQ
jgi:hypothetical protein